MINTTAEAGAQPPPGPTMPPDPAQMVWATLQALVVVLVLVQGWGPLSSALGALWRFFVPPDDEDGHQRSFSRHWGVTIFDSAPSAIVGSPPAPGAVGIINLGLTCFSGAMLQCLAAIPVPAWRRAWGLPPYEASPQVDERASETSAALGEVFRSLWCVAPFPAEPEVLANGQLEPQYPPGGIKALAPYRLYTALSTRMPACAPRAPQRSGRRRAGAAGEAAAAAASSASLANGEPGRPWTGPGYDWLATAWLAVWWVWDAVSWVLGQLWLCCCSCCARGSGFYYDDNGSGANAFTQRLLEESGVVAANSAAAAGAASGETASQEDCSEFLLALLHLLDDEGARLPRGGEESAGSSSTDVDAPAAPSAAAGGVARGRPSAASASVGRRRSSRTRTAAEAPSLLQQEGEGAVVADAAAAAVQSVDEQPQVASGLCNRRNRAAAAAAAPPAAPSVAPPSPAVEVLSSSAPAAAAATAGGAPLSFLFTGNLRSQTSCLTPGCGALSPRTEAFTVLPAPLPPATRTWAVSLVDTAPLLAAPMLDAVPVTLDAPLVRAVTLELPHPGLVSSLTTALAALLPYRAVVRLYKLRDNGGDAGNGTLQAPSIVSPAASLRALEEPGLALVAFAHPAPAAAPVDGGGVGGGGVESTLSDAELGVATLPSDKGVLAIYLGAAAGAAGDGTAAAAAATAKLSPLPGAAPLLLDLPTFEDALAGQLEAAGFGDDISDEMYAAAVVAAATRWAAATVVTVAAAGADAPQTEEVEAPSAASAAAPASSSSASAASAQPSRRSRRRSERGTDEEGDAAVPAPAAAPAAAPAIVASLRWDDTRGWGSHRHHPLHFDDEQQPPLSAEAAASLGAVTSVVIGVAPAAPGATCAFRLPLALALAAGSNGDGPVTTLADCLNQHTAPERLSGSNAWACPRCNRRVAAEQSSRIVAAPDVLVVALKRFVFLGSGAHLWAEKIQRLVDFPLRGLDLSPWMTRPSSFRGAGEKEAGEAVYDCFAVCHHLGEMDSGHYVAYTRHADGAGGSCWYRFDDAAVTSIGDESDPAVAAELVSPRCYMLMYVKRAVAL